MPDTGTAAHVDPVSASEHGRRWWILGVLAFLPRTAGTDVAVGPSLFNTIAGSVLADSVNANAADDPARSARDTSILAAATVHSYTVAFVIAGGILLGAALVSALMLHPARHAAGPAPTPTAATP